MFDIAHKNLEFRQKERNSLEFFFLLTHFYDLFIEYICQSKNAFFLQKMPTAWGFFPAIIIAAVFASDNNIKT